MLLCMLVCNKEFFSWPHSIKVDGSQILGNKNVKRWMWSSPKISLLDIVIGKTRILFLNTGLSIDHVSLALTSTYQKYFQENDGEMITTARYSKIMYINIFKNVKDV